MVGRPYFKVFAGRAKGTISRRSIVKTAVCTGDDRLMNLVLVVVTFKASMSRLEPFEIGSTFNGFSLSLFMLHLLV